MPAMTSDADVLIVGAGPSGLALAAALGDAGLSVLVLEQQARGALDDPSDDGREIALTHRAQGVMQALGMWSRLPPDAVATLREARVMNGDSNATLRFADAGLGANLGWLVPNHQIRRAALAAALARPGVRLLCEARVAALDRDADTARLTLNDGRSFSAPLVVAADSRHSQTRRLAGIGAQMHDFGRSVIVGRVAHSIDHQGVAWECFRYGNTLALLPMNGSQSSAVVTVGSDLAAHWLAIPAAEFAARVQAQTAGRLGEVHCVGGRHLYPLVGVYAHRFVAPRFALIGDAAVGMHPVTAHGYNFGLYGVEVLARECKAARSAGRDIGALAVLEGFEREHRRTTLPVYLGTNAVVSLFTDERGPARIARSALLALAEHAPGLSRLIKAGVTRQLTGGVSAATR
jgi:ubiquinone biosynthesis UbiH/UbiF/VisC/COQ6 family hydroxylase